MNKQTILVVDDDDGMMRVLEKSLTTDGYEVIKARSGEDALPKAKKQLPQLIIMDLMLPQIDGSEAVKILQDNHATKDIPVLFISSILDKASEAEPKVRVGETTYEAIAKPFSHKDLIAKVRKILE